MQFTSLRSRQSLFALVAAGTLAASATGMFISRRDVPVDRLIANLSAFTKEHPEDANGFYTLGRAHSLAFTRAVDAVPASSDGTGVPPGGVVDDGTPTAGPRNSDPELPKRPLSEEARTQHLSLGIAAFEKAWRLKPDDAEHCISFAFLLEQGLDRAMDVSTVPDLNATRTLDASQRTRLEGAFRSLDSRTSNSDSKPVIEKNPDDSILAGWPIRATLGPNGKASLKKLVVARWDSAMERLYLEAFQLSLPSDLKRHFLIGGLSELISHEAGTAYLRLLSARPQTPEDKSTVSKVEAGLRSLKKKEFGSAVTPIVFGLAEQVTLSSLLDEGRKTRFDLDGTASDLRWDWVCPDTGILVWDPRHTGKIESGLQLFGNASWWMLFADGYRALDALDDNRDGELSGHELEGIAVWFDRNGNGISDPGEVVSLTSCGIVGISTRQTSTSDGCPANLTGLRMRDGRRLPTYDWIATGVPMTTPDECSDKESTFVRMDH